MTIMCQVPEEAGVVGTFGESNVGEYGYGVVIETSRSLLCPVGCFAKACDFSRMWKTFRYIYKDDVLYGSVEVGIGQVELDDVIFSEG